MESFDVSQEKNGSVMAWFLDADGNGKYELYIGQTGNVIVTTGSYLFSYFTNVTSVDLTYLDISSVTDMSYMFNNCRGLINLDLSHNV